MWLDCWRSSLPAPRNANGVEKTDETGRLCRLNLAVHGVESRESLSSDAQAFHEHGKRFVVSTVGAVASGDAQWFRAGR